MIDSAAGMILLVLLAVVFKNYRDKTLKQWLSSKFFGAGSTAGPGQRLVGAFGGNALGSAGDSSVGSQVTAAGAEIAGATSTTALDLVTVRGVRLRRSVATSWGQMVDAAAADGVTITGGGYRSEAEQVALRAGRGCGGAKAYDKNCKCSPPTATPQSSEHCKGRAVDVDNCGHGSKAFAWLSSNAGRFGWYNLPSESWHWSVTGH